jgi:hypothetical protein
LVLSGKIKCAFFHFLQYIKKMRNSIRFRVKTEYTLDWV